MSHLKYGAGILCLLLLSGCATFIEVRIKRAPEINLVNVKTIKIEPFDVSGRISFDSGGNPGGGGLLGAMVGMAVDAGIDKIAESRHPAIQQAEWAGLKDRVFSDGFYKVSEGGEFDARVTGTIHYEVTDSGEVRSYKKDDKVIDYYELTRKVSVEVRFTVLNKAGIVVGTSEVRGYAEKLTRDPDRDWVRKHAPVWDDLVREALLQTPEPFLRKIAPYFVTESRTFENGDADSIKAGNQAAGKGDWATAVQYWKDAEANGAPKDKVAALYNLGIYDEVDGRLQDALGKFEEVKNLSGDTKYNTDIMRTQARIAEEEKLRSLSAAPVPAYKNVPAPGPSDGLQAWKKSPGLRVVRENGLHRFNWDPLPNAAGYHVFTSPGKGKSLSQLNHKLLAKPQLRAKVLPRGKALVQVVAFDEDGNEIAKTVIQALVMP